MPETVAIHFNSTLVHIPHTKLQTKIQKHNDTCADIREGVKLS